MATETAADVDPEAETESGLVGEGGMLRPNTLSGLAREAERRGGGYVSPRA